MTKDYYGLHEKITCKTCNLVTEGKQVGGWAYCPWCGKLLKGESPIYFTKEFIESLPEPDDYMGVVVREMAILIADMNERLHKLEVTN